MRLFRRKPQVLRVEGFKPSSEDNVFDVSLSFLRGTFNRLYETGNAVYGLNGDGVFRFKKKNFMPKILKASSLSYEPTTTVIQTSFKGLSEIAEKYDCEIFELKDSYAIIYPGLLWLSKKEGRG